MKKILLILVLSLLAVGISFSVFVQGGQALTVGGPAIYEQEDWEKKYYELKAEYDALLNRINDIYQEVMDLRSEFEKTESELTSLGADYTALEADYRSLNVRYQSAVRDLNTRTTMMYAFIVTTVVFLATTLYLALIRPKVGT